MQLITVQHRLVLTEITKKATYYADMMRVPDNRKKAYKSMMQFYNWHDCPVFCGKIGKRAEFLGVPEDKSYIMIELNVPDELVRLQEYYDWSDYIYYTNHPLELTGTELEDFAEFVMNRKAPLFVVQATIPFIKKDWVTNYKNLTDKFITTHIGSGGQNILTPLSEY